MEKRELLYEGKAKRVFKSDEPGMIIQDFKDSATAFDGKKKGEIGGKGSVNAKMTVIIFRYLEEQGVSTHLVEQLSDHEIATYQLDMLKLEVIVRNIAAGSLAKRVGYPEGQELREPLVEYYLKDDSLHDPMLAPNHIWEMELVTPEQLEEITVTSLKINQLLIPFFQGAGLKLVDFKLEFGLKDGRMLLADEFSPDNCRLWDTETGEIMDKDRFRRDLGKLEETYAEVLRRVQERSA